MSIGNRDEKQQNHIRYNNDMLTLQPQIKQKNQKNQTQQAQIANQEQNNANFLLQSNTYNTQLTERDDYQPKGSRPQSKNSSLMKRQNFYTENYSKMDNYTDLTMDYQQNMLNISMKANLQAENKKQQFQNKPNLNILKIIKEAFHTHFKANKKYQIRTCDSQGNQDYEKQKLSTTQQCTQKQLKNIQINNQRYKLGQQDEQISHPHKIGKFRSKSTQRGQNPKLEDGQHTINEQKIVDQIVKNNKYNQKINYENEDFVYQGESYGVEDIHINGGGGGKIKKKRKYDYKFRDVDELAEESERSSPFGLIEMRLTPRLYDKRQKLKTIHEWKNQKMISCEEDLMLKQDLIQAKKQNKKRMEEQLNIINKQQFEWEHLASYQLSKNLIKNEENQTNNKNQTEQELKIFQEDFDKRIHNLYINEKMKKFQVEQQNTYDQINLHTECLQKEKEKFKEQELQTQKEKLKQKQLLYKTFHWSLSESPDKINNFSTLNYQKDYQKFNNTFQYEKQAPFRQNDMKTIVDSSDKTKSGSQVFLKNILLQKINRNEELTKQDSFTNYLTNQTLNTINKSDENDNSLNDQINSLYTYYQNLDKNKEQIKQTSQNTIKFTTIENNEKESLETYIQQSIINQDKAKLPQIEKTPLKRTPIPFTLSEQKPKQTQQQSFQSGQKKLSADSNILSNQKRCSTRNQSPQTKYNVQIDNQNKHQRNHSSNTFNQTRYLLGRRKGFMNQTFIRC